jgi:hypothetical protein
VPQFWRYIYGKIINDGNVEIRLDQTKLLIRERYDSVRRASTHDLLVGHPLRLSLDIGMLQYD